MDLEKNLKAVVAKNLNIPGLVADALAQIVNPALQDAVAKSATKLDDLALAALAPILESELNSRLKSAWESLLSDSPAAPAAPSGPVL